MNSVVAFIGLLLLVTYVQSRPTDSDNSGKASSNRKPEKEIVPYIIHYENDKSEEGYNFAYETSDGIAREEEMEMMNAGTDDEYIIMRGSYSYVGPDGVLYTVSYVADKDGFRPTGPHLPTSNLIRRK